MHQLKATKKILLHRRKIWRLELESATRLLETKKYYQSGKERVKFAKAELKRIENQLEKVNELLGKKGAKNE